ncbi:MAG: hypothetical protein NTZ56_17710 [Acidobacteria bacterium]|nr:hypothetical protein [Acidobacteriota bacterium]
MRRIMFSAAAEQQYRAFSKVKQTQLKEGIKLHLGENDPAAESRNKFRLRRPSPHADFELRLHELRVFYRISRERVEVLLLGEKVGDKLYVGGEEFEL